jgi:hypothetical protein
MMLRNQQLAIERVQSGEATLRHVIFGVSAAAVIPASLHAKVIVLPWLNSTSICRNFATTCSGVIPFPGIAPAPSGL